MSEKQIPTILAIGKATQDVFLKSNEFDPHQEGKVAYTHLPLGAKLDLEDVIFATGGNATNAAVTFARQGLHSKYMWILGEEPASQTILHDLDHEGVDTSHVIQSEEYRASYSSIMLSPSGERTILNFHGSAIGSDGYPLDLSAIAHSDWIYISALNTPGLLEEVFSIAVENGVKIMFNPSGIELSDPEKLKALLEDVDVLALNKEEMQQLVHGESIEELVLHGTHYCPVVIVSDGPNGVCASDKKVIVKAGMYEDVPVVDRTGAGDAFGSGFLSQWSRGRSLEESIIFASANSTSVVSQIGAKSGILHQGVELHDMPIETKALRSVTMSKD